MISAEQLKSKHPLNEINQKKIIMYKQTVKDILDRKCNKKLAIVGPCSIHSVSEAIDYALKLKHIKESVKDNIFVVMRVYLEKPRTTVGWKGFLNDPDLDETYDIEKGLIESRKLMLKLTDLCIPIGTELLNPNFLCYFNDLISWYCIGARTSESQIHREIASGMQVACGFKNGTTGSIKVAIDGILSAQEEHFFPQVGENGSMQLTHTQGNKHCFIILRGGWDGSIIKPNYYNHNIQEISLLLKYVKLPSNIIIDCSHSNSRKKYENQEGVVKYVSDMIQKGDENIIGIMIESNIHCGRQDISDSLKYGVSITDACIDINTTSQLLEYFNVSIGSISTF